MCKGSKKIGNGGIKKKFFEKIIFLVLFWSDFDGFFADSV